VVGTDSSLLVDTMVLVGIRRAIAANRSGMVLMKKKWNALYLHLVVEAMADSIFQDDRTFLVALPVAHMSREHHLPRRSCPSYCGIA
jgi:hypothetical protein